ncbi:hypothetical protein FN846DRAFT_977163 [Sphaerosporella brunnea]|uniref:Uncharacterized protein n=1 Tax=Sphaerosporella brunnea TaxID=1250544 RepID=A0A5J5EFS1_9PEZI|nr:hypothetical protein FN846DRAFT_977163 [Sphaerosporella brunnea]
MVTIGRQFSARTILLVFFPGLGHLLARRKAREQRAGIDRHPPVGKRVVRRKAGVPMLEDGVGVSRVSRSHRQWPLAKSIHVVPWCTGNTNGRW